MKRLTTRIDDDLHAQLKARAKADGRSMNALVVEVLLGIVRRPETPRQRKARLLAEGKLVSFKPDGDPPGHDELERCSRGWGTAVSEALDWARGEW
ncbi:type II toxin-antitoxin system HicB family antitoxin [Amycolatopsis sp. NBC_00345]|uniref:FitA-like ribbon-helix-helix domain-containing protein n=1 Tax=Amycolatopsis sp. NBC_00345 TaxID=2975955 RepID=UPI002E253B69